ncbi:MAG: ABC transporter permease subunit [Spirochaetes bacterium]|nr:ABC transporter permease subunit [Spirochaetota bacterium]
MKVTGLLKTAAGKISGVLLILLVWSISASYISDIFILPGPQEVFLILKKLVVSGSAFSEFRITFIRSIAGLSIALCIGTSAGILLGLSRTVYDVFHSVVVFIQSTPVIAWILLAIIWFSTEMVPVYVVAIAVIPVITLNCTEGILRTDKKILQMAALYKVGKFRILYCIYLPAVTGYLISAVKIALGLTFRVAVMAEVLVHPGNGIGEKMNWARINIETGEVLAWTVIIVAATLLFDQITDILFRFLFRKYND